MARNGVVNFLVETTSKMGGVSKGVDVGRQILGGTEIALHPQTLKKGQAYHSKSIRSSKQLLLAAVPTVCLLFWLDFVWAGCCCWALVGEVFASEPLPCSRGLATARSGVRNCDRFRSFIRIIIDYRRLTINLSVKLPQIHRASYSSQNDTGKTCTLIQLSRRGLCGPPTELQNILNFNHLDKITAWTPLPHRFHTKQWVVF